MKKRRKIVVFSSGFYFRFLSMGCRYIISCFTIKMDYVLLDAVTVIRAIVLQCIHFFVVVAHCTPSKMRKEQINVM